MGHLLFKVLCKYVKKYKQNIHLCKHQGTIKVEDIQK